MRFKTYLATLTIMAVILLSSGTSQALRLHNFECGQCHKSTVDWQALDTGNLCLQCHSSTPATGVSLLDDYTKGSNCVWDPAVNQVVCTPTPDPDGPTVDAPAGFSGGDASNQFGSNPSPGNEISHNWAARINNPAAGSAGNPTDPMYNTTTAPRGASGGSVTCFRCHDPHGAKTFPQNADNKILRVPNYDRQDPATMVAQPAEIESMCVVCHADWSAVTTAENGLESHPLVKDYATFVDNVRFKTFAPGTSSMKLVDTDNDGNSDDMACTTCHGMHNADSGGANDGAILLGDGASIDPNNLCNSCHIYNLHPSSTGNQIGCLDCHSGHSYNDGTPNYYLLRAEFAVPATSTLPTKGTTVSGMRFTDDPDTLDPNVRWAGSGSTGFCEYCHGDVENTAAGFPSEDRAHTEGETCENCHSHNDASGTIDSFGPVNCDGCHGFPPIADTAGGPNGFADSTLTTNVYSASASYMPEDTAGHITHASGSGNYSFTCDKCHGAGANTSGNSGHDTGTFQEVLDNADAPLPALTTDSGALSPSYSWADLAGTNNEGYCSNTYCHSNGGPRGAAPTAVTTPAWEDGNGTINACNVCHGNDDASMTSRGNSGSHNAHLNKGYDCGVCHSLTATDSTTLLGSAIGGSGTHVDGDPDVSADLTQASLPGSFIYASNGECSNLYCHSNGSGTNRTPDWDLPASGACGTCHDGAGGSLPDAHYVHLDDPNGPTLNCDACHTHNGSGTDHVNGTFDLTTGACDTCHGKPAGAGTGPGTVDEMPSWTDPSTVRCETCHSGTLAVIGGNTAPLVSEAAYANGHGKTGVAQGCTDCHEANTVAGHLAGDSVDRLSSTLPAYTAGDDRAFCNDCHTTVGSVNNHNTLDGTICKTCHTQHGEDNGFDAMIMSTVATNTVAGFADQTVVTSFVNSAGTGVCQTCHTATAHYQQGDDPRPGGVDDMHPNDPASGQIADLSLCTTCHDHSSTPAFAATGDSCDSCHGYPPASAAHNVHAPDSDTLDTAGKVYRDGTNGFADVSTCTHCHTGADQYTYDPSADQASGTAGRQNHNAGETTQDATLTSSVGYDSTNLDCASACHNTTAGQAAAWTDTSLSCAACHGNPPANGGGDNTAHADHLTAGLTCATCHGDDPTDTGHIDPKTGADELTKVQNMTDTSIDGANVTEASWNGTDNTCNNTACHNPSSDGHLANWDTSTSSCTLCHGDDATLPATTGMVSGSHQQHLDNASIIGDNAVCTDCHTGAGGDTAHRDGTVDFAAAAGWGALAADTCGSNTSCHQDGFDPVQSPVWGSVVAPATVCDLCHATPVNAGDHGGHWVQDRFDRGLQCASCHNATVNENVDPANDLTTIKAGGNHIDGNIYDIAAGFNFDGAAVGIFDYTQGTPSTCSTNCHFVNPKPWEPSTGCASCHGDLSYVETKTSSGGNTHTAHINITGSIENDLSECVVCHGTDINTYTITGGDGGSGNHQDGSTQVVAGISTAATGCTAACHDSGSSDGNWADADGLNCTACHNNGTNDDVLANAAPATGAHDAHVATQGMTCADCHGTLPTNTNHISGLDATGAAGGDQGETLTNRAAATADNAAVDDTPFNDAGNSFNDTTNSCSNTYCHDPSDDNTLADWDSDSASCNLCHGYDRTSAAVMATGSHSEHLNAVTKFGLTTLEDCLACHPDNSGNNGHFISSTGPTVVNQAAQIAGTVIDGTTYTYSGELALPNTSYGSCGTTPCHNNGQGAAPASDTYTWNTTVADDCNTCHDKRPATNSHTFHTGTTAYGPHPTGSTDCGECHNANSNNTTMAGLATHIDGSRDFADANSLANHGGIFGTATTGIVGDTTVTVCNSCHGGQTAADLAKNNWVNQQAVGCESCHGDYNLAVIGGVTAPDRATDFDTVGHGKPTTPASAIGGSRAVNQACTDCHDNNAAHISGSLNDAERLNLIGGVDYAVDPNGFCNACHVAVVDSAVHYANSNTTNGNSDDALLCTTCHDQHGQGGQDAMVSSSIQGNTVSGFSDRAARASYANGSNQGVCQVCHDPAEVLHFNTGTEELATHNSGSNCTVCHSHQDDPIFAASGCNGCHGGGTTGSSASNYWPDDSNVRTENDAGAHVTHMSRLSAKVYGQTLSQLLDDINSDSRQKALCDYCHEASTNDGDHGNTTNLPAEVFPSGYNKTLWGAAGSASYNATADTCATAECHNNKTTTDGTFGWYDGNSGTCTMCHTAGGSGANPTTGLHNPSIATAHDDTLGGGCAECHNAMPAIDNTGSATHINGSFAVDSGVNDDRGITVSGNITAFTQAAVGTTDSCAASCHSDGGSWERLWSTDADSNSETLGDARCNVCHGYLNTFRDGMTPDHSAIAKINDGTHGNCSTCHVRPNAPYDTAATYHNTNSPVGSPTELGAPGRAIEVNDTVGYDMANGNCTNICHTNDAAHTVGTSSHFPANGLAGPNANCNTCHFDTGGSFNTDNIGGYTFSNSVGAHAQHANSAATAYGDAVNHSTDAGYDYGCGICHSTTGTDHLNGVLDLNLEGNADIVNGAGANYDTTTTGACSGVFCHSDGEDVSLANAKSPTWTGSFSNPNGDYCQNCHGNQPTTTSHAAHVVGIHFDDIYSGTSGLIAAGGASGAGHGDVNTALTINCNMCHTNTVNQWYNGNNTACVSCHGTSGSATNKTVTTTADINETNHVNGIKDVDFSPAIVTIRSKSQVRDFTTTEPELNDNWQRINGYKAGASSHDESKQVDPLVGIWDGSNCTVACHNDNTIAWGTTGISCNACHTQLPK